MKESTTIEAVARAVQSVVNSHVDNAGNEVLIIGGMTEMCIHSKVNGKAVKWPLKDGSYYILTSMPVGAGETIRATGILAGITIVTESGVMA